MSKTSPTARTLALLRQEGATCQVVERWCAFSRRRIDLFGFADVVALRPGQLGLLAVQATADSCHSARRHKTLDNAAARLWIACGNRLEIWSWGKRGRGRKTWQVRREALTLEDFDPKEGGDLTADDPGNPPA